MSYRPITDTWLLARPKSKFYGAFPAGFLLRAHALLGCSREDAVLHVCSGDIAGYRCGPGCRGNGDHWHGFGPHDITVDVDATLKSDYHLDVRYVESFRAIAIENPNIQGVLADPPYTKQFAANYSVGPDVFPNANTIVKNALSILPISGRVGILSMEWPLYPKAMARQIAVVGVYVGNGNIGRTFAVYERTAPNNQVSRECLGQSAPCLNLSSQRVHRAKRPPGGEAFQTTESRQPSLFV
jgi:hypothetical protein